MPPTQANSKNSKATTSTKQELNAIQTYLSKKPDFEKLKQAAKKEPQAPAQVASTEYDLKLKEAVNHIISDNAEQRTTWPATMPVIPGDNDKDIKEKLAQGKADAEAKKEGKASSQHHEANLGPVLAENLGEPASKEELKKRAEELNK